ncbi:DEAD/DEAH box helicase [Methylosinus sp. H3A]|uniref:DEAD/DEAH box helicase n=1 Tax=Methylosinus sp. H3A TaxID=2785786 RepID=UPI0018C284B8|nr:DEAD/DEAH box helicase [Methylosinus sp. H3A]MBG0812458.1 DEAD/DEAH box helicase [Methylosinus sp. H3A]
MSFFETSPALARALAERQYIDPTPVQSAVLAGDAAGRDILVSAQTGSGKTVAYGLAIASTILDDVGMVEATLPLALVIAPTRELALQVAHELEWLYHYADARLVTCVGGMDARLERRKLAEGAHIVVGTPGRLRDHIERGGLNTSGLAAVVLDEADEMLDLGFREDLEFILDSAPAGRRTLMFSATMPKGIANLARRYQSNALRIEVAGGERGHADIEYRAISVAPKDTEHAVVNLLRFVEAQTAIVFCNTRESVRHLQATLLERGFSTVLLSGELSQHERNQSMQALRDGRARVCVATDVAARGIDLPNLGLVVHAELPNDAETLQHRSGRTGRAGRKGVSALLVPASRRSRAERLLRDAGVRARWTRPPTMDDIRQLDQERLLSDPLLTAPPDEEDLRMARLLLAERSAEQIAAALVKVCRSRLPAVEDVIDPGEEPERPDAREKPAKARRERPTRSVLAGGKAWFRLDIGRSRNADPKWLLPMLCRKGNITRQDIGAIRIFEHETKVEVAESVAPNFLRDMRRPGGDNIRVERLAGDAEPSSFDPPAKKAGKAKKRPAAERRTRS